MDIFMRKGLSASRRTPSSENQLRNNIAREEAEWQTILHKLSTNAAFHGGRLNLSFQWRGRGQQLVDTRVKQLADALAINRSLLSLWLIGNPIGDNGCVVLAESMKKNTTLQELLLKEIGASEVGYKAFAGVIEVNSTLKSLDLSGNKNDHNDHYGLLAVAEALKHNTSLTDIKIFGYATPTHLLEFLDEEWAVNARSAIRAKEESENEEKRVREEKSMDYARVTAYSPGTGSGDELLVAPGDVVRVVTSASSGQSVCVDCAGTRGMVPTSILNFDGVTSDHFRAHGRKRQMEKSRRDAWSEKEKVERKRIDEERERLEEERKRIDEEILEMKRIDEERKSGEERKSKRRSEHEAVAEWLDGAVESKKYHATFLEQRFRWADLTEIDKELMMDIGIVGMDCRRILMAVAARTKFSPSNPTDDLSFLHSHFDVQGRIVGGQHQLALATMKDTGHDVVVKIYDNKAEFDHERQCLVDLRSNCIVNLVGSREYDDRYVLALERGVETVHDMLERGSIDPDWALPLIKQAVQCVAFIHQKGIVHTDIKPKNFLIIADSPTTLRLVLIDFDGACNANRDTLPSEVTGSYCAAERLTNKDLKATPAVDVWSLGVMIYEMLTGRRLGVGMTEDELRELLTDDSLKPFDFAAVPSAAAHRMLEPMLQRDPSKRCSISDVLRHSYLSGATDTEMAAVRKNIKVVREGVSELVMRE